MSSARASCRIGCLDSRGADSPMRLSACLMSVQLSGELICPSPCAVQVHCANGQSRSVAVVAAWLLHASRARGPGAAGTADGALRYVHQCRSVRERRLSVAKGAVRGYRHCMCGARVTCACRPICSPVAGARGQSRSASSPRIYVAGGVRQGSRKGEWSGKGRVPRPKEETYFVVPWRG